MQPSTQGALRITATRASVARCAPSDVLATLVIGEALLTAHRRYVLRWDLRDPTPAACYPTPLLHHPRMYPLAAGGFALVASTPSEGSMPVVLVFDADGHPASRRELHRLGTHHVLRDGRLVSEAYANGATTLCMLDAAGQVRTRCWGFGFMDGDPASGRALLAGDQKVGVVEPDGVLREARAEGRSIACVAHAGRLVRCTELPTWKREYRLEVFDVESLERISAVPCAPIRSLASDGETLAMLGRNGMVATSVLPPDDATCGVSASLSTKYAVFSSSRYIAETEVTEDARVCDQPPEPQVRPGAEVCRHPRDPVDIRLTYVDEEQPYTSHRAPYLVVGERQVYCPDDRIRLGPWIEDSHTVLLRCGPSDGPHQWYSLDADAPVLNLVPLGHGRAVTTRGHQLLVLLAGGALSTIDTRTGATVRKPVAAPGVTDLLAGSARPDVSWVVALREGSERNGSVIPEGAPTLGGQAASVVVLRAETVEEVGSLAVAATDAYFEEDGRLVIVDRLGAQYVVEPGSAEEDAHERASAT